MEKCKVWDGGSGEIMTGWFPRLPKRHQVRIFGYLDKLAHVKDYRLKIETMMHKTKWHELFCKECVDEWNAVQDSQASRKIYEEEGPLNLEVEGNLF